MQQSVFAGRWDGKAARRPLRHASGGYNLFQGSSIQNKLIQTVEENERSDGVGK